MSGYCFGCDLPTKCCGDKQFDPLPCLTCGNELGNPGQWLNCRGHFTKSIEHHQKRVRRVVRIARMWRDEHAGFWRSMADAQGMEKDKAYKASEDSQRMYSELLDILRRTTDEGNRERDSLRAELDDMTAQRDTWEEEHGKVCTEAEGLRARKAQAWQRLESANVNATGAEAERDTLCTEVEGLRRELAAVKAFADTWAEEKQAAIAELEIQQALAKQNWTAYSIEVEDGEKARAERDAALERVRELELEAEYAKDRASRRRVRE